MRISITAATCPCWSSRDTRAGICSSATRELCAVLLPDSGHLQEEQAEYANRHEFSKHHPALPLYSQEDAEQALQYLVAVDFKQDILIGGEVKLRMYPAGHIPGAASVELRDQHTSIIFSGDLGRPDDPIMYPPTPLEGADYLVVESTYGNRRHPPQDAQQLLGEIINRTAQRGGVVIIPAFAGWPYTNVIALHATAERCGHYPGSADLSE